MSEFVFDVTAAEFETAVLARSQQTPILLDFWAEWCEPCKTLRPVLDKLAEEYGGAFLLGAVNTEVEQELAAAFQVQGIPFCVVLDKGRPVDAFQGAVGEDEVRAILDRAGIKPAVAAPAEEEVAELDPLSKARQALLEGDAAAAAAALEGFPEEDEGASAVARIQSGLEIFAATIEASESAAADFADKGRVAFGERRAAEAAEAWFASIEADRGWRDGLARRALVMMFEALGVNDAGKELVREMRQRLAIVLY